MNTQQIVEKALKGEDYSVDIKDFSDEDKTKVTIAIRDASEAAAKESLAKMSGIKKESERREENEKAKASFETFHAEKIQKVKTKFLSDPDLALTDVQKAKIEADFKTSKVDEELILEDLQAYYAGLNSKKLLEDSKRLREHQKNADDFMAGQAGGGGSGGGSPDDDKYSAAAKDLFKAWQKEGYKKKTLADAQRMVDRQQSTGDFRSRNLAD